MIAFLTVVNESIGQPEARYVHLGMTSQDLNDTAMAVQLVESARIIAADLATVREAAAELAVRHRRTLMAGRTHGVVAEPITFGFKVAGWVAELDRAQDRLARAAEEVAVGRVSGAVGTHATIDPQVEEHVCRELGLRPDAVSTQVVARDRARELHVGARARSPGRWSGSRPRSVTCSAARSARRSSRSARSRRAARRCRTSATRCSPSGSAGWRAWCAATW